MIQLLPTFCSLFFDMVFKFSFVRANFLFYQFQSQISYFLDYNRETLPGGISIFLLGSSLNCTSSHWCFFKVEHSVIYIWYKYPIFFTGLFCWVLWNFYIRDDSPMLKNMLPSGKFREHWYQDRLLLNFFILSGKNSECC